MRERTQRAEAWLLRQAWGIGASGLTTNPETGGGITEGAHLSVWVLKFKEQAELDLERTTPELERGPKRVEAADVDAPRSEQVREAMLEAQRRREVVERRSARGCVGRGRGGVASSGGGWAGVSWVGRRPTPQSAARTCPPA